jgi:hypothetical protein
VIGLAIIHRLTACEETVFLLVLAGVAVTSIPALKHPLIKHPFPFSEPPLQASEPPLQSSRIFKDLPGTVSLEWSFRWTTSLSALLPSPVNFNIFLTRRDLSPEVSLGCRQFRVVNDFKRTPDLALDVQQRPLEGANAASFDDLSSAHKPVLL